MTPLIRRGRIAEASERPADSPQISAIAQTSARRRLIAFVGIGIAAYAVGLIARMPASAVVENAAWRTGIGGTVWNGEVGLAGGSRLEWHWAPLRSLVNLGFAVDWRASGAVTDLAGSALIGPSSTRIDAMSGAADASILRAIQPDLPFVCDMPMQLDFPHVKIGGGGQRIDGRLLTEAGSCRPAAGGTSSTVGPLLLTAETIGDESRLRLTPAQQRRRTLMTFRLSDDGDVDIGMTPEGAAALPFVGLPPGASIKGRI